MVMKFNGGNPVYICDECRVVISEVRMWDPELRELPICCDSCAEKLLGDDDEAE